VRHVDIFSSEVEATAPKVALVTGIDISVLFSWYKHVLYS